MIHPHTRIHYINDQMGYGVFATQFIPEGTITYIKDSLELEISPEAYAGYPPALQDTVEKYSFIDDRGYRIVSWDFAKYVNHCCSCNTMSTGYGFEIAIRDIQPGEQLTDEYGLFNLEYEMPLDCHIPGCRRKITPFDLDIYFEQWDSTVRTALRKLQEVDQPLSYLIDAETADDLQAFLQDNEVYRSVYSLKNVHAIGQAAPLNLNGIPGGAQ